MNAVLYVYYDGDEAYYEEEVRDGTNLHTEYKYFQVL